jgi:hypothetical protein
MFCPKCGAQNSDAASFCVSCGQPLNAAASSTGSGTYGTPPPPPVQNAGMGVKPKNWLVESILVTIFCCLPLGIVGIINASKVDGKFAAGDHAGAQQSSAEAAKWTKIGFFVGIGVSVIYGIWLFLLGGMAVMNSGTY